MTLETKNLLRGVAALVIIFAAFAILLYLFTGCCPSRCIRTVEVPYPVEVGKPCRLPPAVELPAVTFTTCTADPKVACLVVDEQAKLALRESRMKQWIKEARAACTPPASAPASAPSSQPASRGIR